MERGKWVVTFEVDLLVECDNDKIMKVAKTIMNEINQSRKLKMSDIQDIRAFEPGKAEFKVTQFEVK